MSFASTSMNKTKTKKANKTLDFADAQIYSMKIECIYIECVQNYTYSDESMLIELQFSFGITVQ